MTLLVVDEVDVLMTRDQAVRTRLYGCTDERGWHGATGAVRMQPWGCLAVPL
jgi:hypothetical protein